MFADQVTRAREDLDRVYEAGKQAAYDAFWDSYQDYGNRTNYTHGFAGIGWTKENMQPKYPVRVVGWCERMFFKNQVKDLVFRDKFDFSQMTDCNYLFAEAGTETMDHLDLSGCQNLMNPFYYLPFLHTIGTLKLRDDGSQTFTNDWMYTEILENITIQGIIGNDVSFRLCKRLSAQSLGSIVAALSDTAAGKTVTFSLQAVEGAFGSQEDPGWQALVQSKPNWNMLLV